MASSYTPLLGLVLPVTGELAGTWGTVWNNEGTGLLDSAIAGTTTLSTDADVTLTTTTGASNQARQAILLCSGARTALRTITAPAQSKIYVVINNTTGGYGVKLVGAGPTAGVTVAAGKTAVLVWNGSDFVEVAPATATTATNLAGGAAGSVPYQSGAGATTFLSLGTAAQVLQVNAGATAPEWVSSTGTGNVVRATSPALTTPTISGNLQIVSSNAVIWGLNSTTNYLQLYNSGTNGVNLASSTSITFLTNGSTRLSISSTGLVNVTGLTASQAVFTDSSKNLVSNAITGSGNVVMSTSPTIATPTITTSATVPLLIGGTGTTSTLTLRSTSGVGTTGADIIFQTGNNGATEGLRVLNSGNVGVQTGATGAIAPLSVNGKVIAGNPYNAGATAFGTFTIGTAGYSSTEYLAWQQYSSTNARAWIGSIGNGNFTADIVFGTNGSVSDSAATEKMRISSGGNLGLATSSPSYLITLGGNSARTVGMLRHTTADTAGNNLTLLAGGATSGATDKNGGSLVLSSGTSTGTGTSVITFQTAAAGSTGTVDNAPAERMRIDGSGNLAIGATSATFRLDVTSAAVSGDVAAFRTTAATNALIAFSDNTPTNVGPRFGSAGNNLVFLTNTSGSAAERMRLTGAGYLGIGTTAPARPLHVASADPGMFVDRSGANPGVIGLRSARGTLASPTQSLANDYLGSLGGFGYTDAAAFTSAAIANINFYAAENITTTAQGSYITLSTTASGTTTLSERMRIDSSGNVGIGITPSGGTRLQVTDASSTAYTSTSASLVAPAGARLSVANTSATNGTFGGVVLAATNAVTNSAIGYIGAVSSSTNYVCDIVFGMRTGATAYAERMRIDSNGNVGIGATTLSSSNKLTVNGNAVLLANGEMKFADATNQSVATIKNSGAATVSQLEFLTGATPTERMRIDSSGNVGIGTNSPAQPLTIGSATANFMLANGATTGASYFRVTSTGGDYIAGLNNAANNVITGGFSYASFVGSNNSTNLHLVTNGTVRATVTGSGNFGIGTSAPGALLEVAGDTRIQGKLLVGLGLSQNKLDINGSLGRKAPVTKTGNFTLADTENWLICNGTGTITVTFPAASSWIGREVMIKTIAAFTVVSASSDVVPLAGGAAGTAILAATAGKWATLVSDGTNWIIMQGN